MYSTIPSGDDNSMASVSLIIRVSELFLIIRRKRCTDVLCVSIDDGISDYR